MHKKTFKVEELKDKINSYLALDTLNQDTKKGLCHVLEEVLVSTGNYHGYHYNFKWDSLGDEERTKLEHNRGYF